MTSLCQAQLADWENYAIDSTDYVKDSGQDGFFESGGIRVPNTYVDDPVFPYWIGWILSKGTDSMTPGFMNEHSAITGGGYDESENYAVSYIVGESILRFSESPQDKLFRGMYVTNSTYSYLSMLNGDGFSKKFGGEMGDDPDFFMLTIRGYKAGNLTTDSIDVMLADYRFDDNSMDYILDGWTFVDLSLLADSDSLSLTMRSSDIGAFGINTPTYVCVDNITWDYFLSSDDIDLNDKIEVINTLAIDILYVNSADAGEIILVNQAGATIRTFDLVKGENHLDVGSLPSGMYYLYGYKSGGSIPFYKK